MELLKLCHSAGVISIPCWLYRTMTISSINLVGVVTGRAGKEGGGGGVGRVTGATSAYVDTEGGGTVAITLEAVVGWLQATRGMVRAASM